MLYPLPEDIYRDKVVSHIPSVKFHEAVSKQKWINNVYLGPADNVKKQTIDESVSSVMCWH